MKRMNIKNMVLLISTVLLSGCDFMDLSESQFYTQDGLLISYSRTKQVVTNIYGYLPTGFSDVDGAMLDAATDDAVHVYETSIVQRFVNGSWAPSYTVDEVFGKYYRGIHDANLYLNDFKDQTFEEWKLNDNYANWIKDYTNYKFEVRFLRAYFYFELVKRYQNVPLVLDVLSMEEANSVVPTSADKVLDFIIDECWKLSEILPVNYTGFVDRETGRITKGMALALRARATLYKASPLFSTNNTDKWKAAAEAAYDLIGNAGTLGYALDPSYENLFGVTNNTSKEVIMARPNGATNAFESANFPMGVTGGRTSTCPTENLVSAYEMITDGSAFDWTNPDMKVHPYDNRDPRLKMTIACNGMNWPYSNPIEIWEGGANGLPLTNATKTGYYLKKYINKGVNFAPGGTPTTPQHNWILFRYAEVLLNYAESMVNAFNSPEYKDAKYPLSALEAVNMVRARTGVKMPAFPSNLSPTDFMKKLKNERRVELAFEGHRFWDLRRWKELPEMKDIYAVKVVKTSSGVDYTKVLLTSYNISNKLYFYPIADTELFKNRNLKQNPDW